MIHIAWPDWEARTSWDQNIVLELTAGDEYQHGKAVPLGEGAVVVIPGQHHVLHAAPLAEQIARLPWALTIVTSDEEALFPVELLPHDDKHAIWGQYHARPEFDRVIPIGAQPRTEQILARIDTADTRTVSVAFLGQNTHARRHEMVSMIQDMASDVRRYGDIAWHLTTGFREGVSQEVYLNALTQTRIAPCPSGPYSVDSFRLYEAIAAGCLPIVEVRTAHEYQGSTFWTDLFGFDFPVPIVDDWSALGSYAIRCRDEDAWRSRRDGVQEWWHRWRAGLVRDFAATIDRLQR